MPDHKSSHEADHAKATGADETGGNTPRHGAGDAAVGTEGSRGSEVDEPDTTGTVFLTLVLLMLIFGFWAMMYVILVDQ